MQNVLRILLLPFIAATIGGVTWAKEEGPDAATPKAADAKSVEYKRSDANYYLKSDILKVNPTAVIIPKGGYTQQDDSYFFTPKLKAPKTLQFEVINDWIEPITPPDAPPTLSIPPDAMQVREPQGDVRVALPSAPKIVRNPSDCPSRRTVNFRSAASTGGLSAPTNPYSSGCFIPNTSAANPPIESPTIDRCARVTGEGNPCSASAIRSRVTKSS